MALTGTWTGRFRYPHGVETSFLAVIRDMAGVLTGEIDDASGDSAGLEGICSGQVVSFTKDYGLGNPNYEHQVRYKGTLSKDENRIDGTWTIEGPEGWSGDFFMQRPKPPKMSARITAEAEIE